MIVEVGFIYGVSAGFEYFPDDGDGIKAIVVDLFILRIAVAFTA